MAAGQLRPRLHALPTNLCRCCLLQQRHEHLFKGTAVARCHCHVAADVHPSRCSRFSVSWCCARYLTISGRSSSLDQCIGDSPATSGHKRVQHLLQRLHQQLRAVDYDLGPSAWQLQLCKGMALAFPPPSPLLKIEGAWD